MVISCNFNPSENWWNMVKLYNDIWLVVEPATPLKNDGVSSSVGMMKFHSQLNGKSFKIPWFQSPPTSYGT